MTAKMGLSFLLTWAAGSLFGQLFVWLHPRPISRPSTQWVHHYYHHQHCAILQIPWALVVTGSSYIIHLIIKQQRIIVERNEELRMERPAPSVRVAQVG